MLSKEHRGNSCDEYEGREEDGRLMESQHVGSGVVLLTDES